MVHLRSRLAAFIRQRRGTTPQRVFARKMGVAQSTIMRIENEDQNVTLQTLEQLCKAFHVDVGDLFPAVDTIRVYQPPLRRGLAAAATIHEKQVAESGDDQEPDLDKA
ncbi:MAG: helix-turn-helix transcriptional regulator [Pseudohongiella sp.]|nr:helix-turn-helix transcriptional regulator [Pseudohongiella sp.]MDO9519311.1 helix-turn-helix transcriptional regulator [Pseudohongiella sp.]MDP2126087.1 helix-turn-helix transcriptional regulator [Pseudohongiella sp.]